MSSDDGFKCSICGTICRNEKILNMHMLSKHKDEADAAPAAAATIPAAATESSASKGSLGSKMTSLAGTAGAAGTATNADSAFGFTALAPAAFTTTTTPPAFYDESEIKSEKNFDNILSTMHNLNANVETMLTDTSSPLYSQKTFEDLNMKPEILKAVYKLGYKKPSRIQESTLPPLLQPVNGRYNSIIAQAQSGTGKTGAFSIALLHRIDPEMQIPQALVLLPSRELAMQVAVEVEKIAVFTPIKVFRAVRNAGIPPAITEQVIVGTPGTVQHLMRKSTFDFKAIRVFVLDEADEMLGTQNFGDMTKRMFQDIERVNKDVQLLFFSATFNDEIKAFANALAKGNAIQIVVPKEELTVDGIRQYFIRCDNKEHKMEVVNNLYSLMTIGSSIIFCFSRETTERLAATMRENGHDVAVLHGQLETSERDEIMDKFRRGQAKVLICTNVLARGIDVLQVSLVINFDLPITGPPEFRPDYETYLHRIGRTGRFGRLGASINLVDGERSMMTNMAIQKHFGRDILQLPSDLVALEESLKQQKLSDE